MYRPHLVDSSYLDTYRYRNNNSYPDTHRSRNNNSYLDRYRSRNDYSYMNMDRSRDNNDSVYVYGPSRLKPKPWERDRDWGRGRITDRYSNRRPMQAPPRDAPKVNEVYLHTERNKWQHRTESYASNELILRRGDTFVMTISRDGQYQRGRRDMCIGLSFGEKPDKGQGTLVEMEIDDSSRERRFPPNEWAAQILSLDRGYITVVINIPVNCIVGEWSLYVKTVARVRNRYGQDVTQVYQYEHPQDIVILFNAWSPYDGVYMESSELKAEYVLNDQGVLFRGTSDNIGSRPWTHAQFEEISLEASLYLLRKGFVDMPPADMSDPVKASRQLVKVINAPDDNGLLVGNWTGNYSGGTSPTTWAGSAKILGEYMRSQAPVKFAQCWVFSAVTTTVFRALGIPCRCVTCFDSAHDTDGNTTIEKKYNSSGEESKDSIWNFHVWNEAWMRRQDIVPKGQYDGWQVVDATPQELSGEVYTCGPAPVVAIKDGVCNLKFDAAFVFAEVNADVVTRERGRVTKRDTRAVGTCILTKSPDTMPGNNGMNLTLKYKYPEGSAEERGAVKNAWETVHYRRGEDSNAYIAPPDVELEIKHKTNVMVGEDFKLAIVMKNNGHYTRIVRKLEVRIFPVSYIGYVGRPFFRREFHNIKIPWRDAKAESMELKVNDYFVHLYEQFNIKIEAMAILEPYGPSNDNLPIMEDVKTRFRRPDITIRSSGQGQVGQLVRLELGFRNPLPVALTRCKLGTDSSVGFESVEDVNIRDVPPYEVFWTRMEIKARSKGRQHVTFSFDCREMKDISGAEQVVIR